MYIIISNCHSCSLESKILILEIKRSLLESNSIYFVHEIRYKINYPLSNKTMTKYLNSKMSG